LRKIRRPKKYVKQKGECRPEECEETRDPGEVNEKSGWDSRKLNLGGGMERNCGSIYCGHRKDMKKRTRRT